MAGLLVSVAILAVLVGGYGYIVLAEPGRSNRTATLVDPPSTSAPSLTAGRPVISPRAAGPADRPVRIAIDSIGVSSLLESVNLDQAGSLQPPSRWEEAGWYARGVVPGSTGPAVIAGHVDSVSGPAVFFRLRELRVGDQVRVTRRDHRVLTFVVDDVQSYPKAVFPTQAVYGPTPLPVLRLVTCTGDFDYRAHSYLDNLVVSAHLA